MLNYKLVRDKIPELIKKEKGEVVFHRASEKEFELALYDKLEEEVKEFLSDPCREEIADIFEVIYAIMKHKDFKFDEVKAVKDKKVEERGAFGERYIALID